MLKLTVHELYRLFISPLAWLILALTQLIMAYLFLTHIDYFMQIQPKLSAIPGAPGVTELIAMPLFNNMAIILLLISPLITMRLIAEERRNDSLPLLLSAPMSVSQIILGKYLGTLIFFLILLLMVSLMPLSLAIGTELDYGLIVSGLLGLALLVAAFSAIGLFISTLTKQPTIAAFSTFSLLFLLWIIDWAAASQATEASSNVLNWLSILRHYEPLLRGDINSNDIAYYLILIFSFLALSIHRLNMQRLS
jgi:ABC-2 type transport system permease protein